MGCPDHKFVIRVFLFGRFSKIFEYGVDLDMRTIISQVFPLFLIMIFHTGLSCTAWGGEPDSMWWRVAGSQKTRDGGMSFDFELHMTGGHEMPTDVDIFCVSSVRHGTSQTRTYGPPDVFRKSVAGDSNPLLVTVYSGRAERIEIRAGASFGGRRYYAGTVVYGYGESGKFDPDALRVEAAPEWPGLSLVAGENFYRAQTGTPISVKCAPAALSVKVFENRSSAGELEADANGAYIYIPPHDETLSRSGYRSKKDIVFEAALPDGLGVASFYIPVYRAFYGQTNIWGGLALLLATAFISLGFVAVWGRRFKPR
jgi:hypothetical protein